METVTDMLALTDDEAVALAVSLPEPWRAPLPSVDLTRRESLVQAAHRGRRSLVVRDLATSGGTPAGRAAEVAKCLATGLRAFFLLSDEAGDWLPGGVTVYLYGPALDAIEVSQTIADAGVHYFRVAPPPGQWQALVMLAEAVHADGFAEQAAGRGKPRPAAALLHVVRPDGIRFIRVVQGAVTTGRGPVPARFPSVPDAVSWLLA
jgi:hypothetical protein